jgi:DNA-binding transcriptional LysR family regulator
MELRHLRYFVAVAEERNITRAAERLAIQQPPLSRLLKALEAEVKARLLVRVPRGVELTEAGLAFYEGARRVLQGVDDALERTRSTARGERGRICIGVTPTGPFVPFVPKCLAAFRETYPEVSLTIEESLSGDLMDGVRVGKIDAAFLWTPRAEGLINMPLVEDELVVALPSRHLLASARRGRGSSIQLNALAKETFVVYGRKDGFGLYAATIAACHSAGFSPRFGEESPRLASALGLVAAGLGIFFIPASLQRVHVDGVVYRALQGPKLPKSTLSLVSRRGERSAVVRNFVALARKAATIGQAR